MPSPRTASPKLQEAMGDSVKAHTKMRLMAKQMDNGK